MFWVHDKFENGLDDPNRSDRPDDLVGMIRPNDLVGPTRKPKQARPIRRSKQIWLAQRPIRVGRARQFHRPSLGLWPGLALLGCRACQVHLDCLTELARLGSQDS